MSSGNAKLLTVAVAQLDNPDLVHALRFATGHTVRLVQVDAQILSAAIQRAYHGDPQALSARIFNLKLGAQNEKNEKPADILKAASGDIAQFFETLLEYALAQQASDIHIEPGYDGCRIKLRVGGELLMHNGCIASKQQHEQLVNRIKILAALDTTEKRHPQDGGFALGARTQHGQTRARVSTLPTIYGEKVVLRLVSDEGRKTIEELGISEPAIACFMRYLQRDEGMVLISGATGSGKTTTLYAALESLKFRNLNMVSVEDPIERVVEGVSQTAIDDKIGLSFAQTLRAILRQDPDVIMLGEIRDEETAQIAAQAALTGHLILSTVHARSSIEAIARMRYLGLDALSIVQSVHASICQKLLPCLCQRCKVIDLQKSAERGFDLWKPVGCVACGHSGYFGQVPALDVLELTKEVQQLILSPDPNTFQQLSEERVVCLEDEVLSLAQQGIIASSVLS
jgi:type IV pilus assembly protein PilB